MWCANCQADVAAEVSVDNKRIRCATCSSEIPASTSSPPGESTRDARELLQRWSNNDLLDPFAPLIDASWSAETQAAETSADGEPATAAPAGSQPKFRVDTPHFAEETAQSSAAEPLAKSAEEHRLHPAHASATAPPHFDVQSVAGDDQVKKTNTASLAGQMLAYAGVGVLTIGTGMVLWGYFGGPAGYTPAGWLITTAGQMLLFLGVVTLVSGGMEQTSQEVARRVEVIGERILRIEQASRDHALKGPSIPAERFADGAPSRTGRTTARQQTGERR